MQGHLGIGVAFIYALLGYLVVFVGLVLLMLVVMGMGKVMVARMKAASAAVPVTPSTASTAPTAPKKLAPGSAGELKIYDTDPRDAALIMAIVADKLQKPLNELRFKSIKEVK